jgi:hypothetical protein
MGHCKHLLMVFLALSTQAAIVKVSLSSADVGTMIGARPGAVALAVTLRLGDTPGSELGGEPKPLGLTLRRAPHWNISDSEGGVKVEMRRPTCALVALGLVVDNPAAVSIWQR